MSSTQTANTAPEAPTPVLTITDEERKVFIDTILKKDSEIESVPMDLISFGPWSNSKYKSLKKCPFQFYLKYILKFKVPEKYQIQSDPLSANVGKAAHEILENVLLGRTVEKAFVATKKNYVDGKIITPDKWVEKVEPLTYNITKFAERIDDFNRRNPIKRVLTELRMGVTRDFQPTGFFSDDVWLRGVIDLILILDCADSVIIDHKTGGGQGPIKPFEEQLDWYKVLMHFGIQKMRGIQVGIHFIGEGDVKMGSYSPAAEIEGNLKNGLEMSLEGAIEMLVEKGYFKHVRGNYCKWCEYDNLGCKSGELKPLELSTKKWIKIHNGK